MARRSEFVDYLVETLAPLGDVRARAMFGGHGIYANDTMFALVADDVLYIKVDDQNEKQFADSGSEPFHFERNGERFAMSYWKAPEETLDDPNELLLWARLGVDASLRKKAGQRKRRR